MAGVTLLLMHGWGFDRTIWAKLCGMLDDVPIALADRGYFGEAVWPDMGGEVIAIGHSLGAMLLLRDPPPNCTALIAINGFDCFTARADFPGVPRRMVDRMAARFSAAPDQVVADFRARCGTRWTPSGPLAADRLEQDLLLLRDGDARACGRSASFPILSLQADDDPILPAEMRDAAFAGTDPVTCETGGHLLPLTRPLWCAAQIRRLIGA